MILCFVLEYIFQFRPLEDWLICYLPKTFSLPGVEPEPFVTGDHLIEASGKLSLLDKVLSFLYDGYVLPY